MSDASCHRCGAEFDYTDGHAKIELEKMNQEMDTGPSEGTYFLLCPVCEKNLIHWMYGDDASMDDQIPIQGLERMYISEDVAREHAHLIPEEYDF